MSRRSLSLKQKGRGIGKRKQSSWQSSINHYFSRKSQATPLTTVDLQKSLDQIDLTDQVEEEKDDVSSNKTPLTCGSTCVSMPPVHEGAQALEAAGDVREEEEEERGREEGKQRGKEGGEGGGGEGGGGGGREGKEGGGECEKEENLSLVGGKACSQDAAVLVSSIDSDKCTCGKEGDGGQELSSLSRSVPDAQDSVSVPLGELPSNKESQSEESSLKTVNPFAKLQFMADSSSNHFVLGQSQIFGAEESDPFMRTSGTEGGSCFKSKLQSQLGRNKREGHPPQSGRKGLSLKVRKRKFVASPLKPQHGGKPAKLVLWRRGEEKTEGPSVEVTSALPLSSEEQAVLLQYSTDSAPQKRVSLADLERETGKIKDKPLTSSSSSTTTDMCLSPDNRHTFITPSLPSPSPLPTSPSFSPHKHTPKAFAHYLSPSSEHTLVSDFTLPLFSPSPSPHRVAESGGSPCLIEANCSGERKGGVRRSLLSAMSEEVQRAKHSPHSSPQSPAHPPPPPPASSEAAIVAGDQQNRAHSAVGGDESFGGDFSFSEFPEFDDAAIVSHDLLAGSHDKSHDRINASHVITNESHDITCRSHDLIRYLVLETALQECTEDSVALGGGGRRRPEVLLRLLDEHSLTERLVYLRDEWVQTPISPGDMVQVNPPPEWNGDRASHCVIDGSNEGSVVVHPDTLISGTSVATSVTCLRRAILADLFKSTTPDSEAMVTGSLLHQVLQGVLVRWGEGGGERVTSEMVEEVMRSILATPETLNQLYSLGVSDSQALSLLSPHTSSIVEWCGRFLHPSPVPGKGDIEFKRCAADREGGVCVAISRVHDIEENIWSPRFGLKGKVDVTAEMKECHPGSGEVSIHRVPVEIKTGKMYRRQGSLEHRAQVSLYSLMLRDRYHDNSIPGGLLYYMKGEHMQGLPAERHEIRSLLLARNTVASYYSNHSGHLTLPGMLKDRHVCRYCPLLPQCTLVHKSMEQGTEETSGISDLFTSHTSHLLPSHLTFFKHWCDLVLREERDGGRGGSGQSFWCSSAQEREKEGCGLSDMVACAPIKMDNGRCLQRFIKHDDSMVSTKHTSPLHTHTPTHSHRHTISPHERVIVSRQDGSAWAVAMGTVTKTTNKEIELLLDKPVSRDGTVFRLDVAPGHSSSASLSNLARLCSADSERDARLRELIIDMRLPHFLPSSSSSSSMLASGGLNPSQTAAVDKVLSSQDYALILGMPGTGKTTTISRLVQEVVAMGYSVLVTSYTHSAVDNILLKLNEAGVDFLRLGPTHHIHPHLHQFTPSHVRVSTVAELEELYRSKLVVATTCLGVNHALFSRRIFDYCIVDEASQTTLPVVLGPLRHARVFVLVGDHYQLPPLVQNHEARERGLSVSLFRRLSECHPQSMVTLEEQYRMNSDIMLLSNTLFYNHQMKCGNVGVASGRLLLPQPDSLPPLTPTWLKRAVSPDHTVVFLNTDKQQRGEDSSGGQVWNGLEVEIVTAIVRALIQCGVSPSQVGVITPYRQQQSKIRESLTSPQTTSTPHPPLVTHTHLSRGGCGPDLCPQEASEVEVNTVDKYQGRDKECVIVSFVRSNSKSTVGTLLTDWRRINVALTRAKHKLILVGSGFTLPSSPPLHALLELLTEQNWITDVI